MIPKPKGNFSKECCEEGNNGILLSQKRMKSCHCNNMNGPRDYYAKWNKSEKDKQYDFT